jgi:hypothetical protein
MIIFLTTFCLIPFADRKSKVVPIRTILAICHNHKLLSMMNRLYVYKFGLHYDMNRINFDWEEQGQGHANSSHEVLSAQSLLLFLPSPK